MRRPGNIFLVGPMGAGKTSVGRRVAKTLHMKFRDADREIEQHTGAKIALIFDIEGESGFRQREKAMLEELTREKNLVMATGGGAVLDPDNRRQLAQRGCVFYLHASVDQLFERTKRDRNRPLLQTEDPRKRLTELMRERDPLYREVADFIVDTDGRTVRSVAEEIVEQVRALPD